MLYQLSHFRVTTHYAEITATVKTPLASASKILASAGQLVDAIQTY